MKIKGVWFGNEEDSFTFEDTDVEEVDKMRKSVNNPNYDWAVEYYTEDGHMILHWPMDEEEAEYNTRVGVDFSPSCPWNAPGMSVSDFI